MPVHSFTIFWVVLSYASLHVSGPKKKQHLTSIPTSIGIDATLVAPTAESLPTSREQDNDLGKLESCTMSFIMIMPFELLHYMLQSMQIHHGGCCIPFFHCKEHAHHIQVTDGDAVEAAVEHCLRSLAPHQQHQHLPPLRRQGVCSCRV